MSNGHAYSRCGTAVVSMMAHSYAVPVLVLCETYKFADRVQVDAISQNELGTCSLSIIGDPMTPAFIKTLY
jgi:translation initiation factor eIF-2B subunit delta